MKHWNGMRVGVAILCMGERMRCPRCGCTMTLGVAHDVGYSGQWECSCGCIVEGDWSSNEEE